jgi:hypothetical protein
VLVELRTMLYAHPMVAANPRIRLVKLGESSLDLEIFAYVPTADYDEFLAVREDIYLRIMDIVAQSGTSLAFPSQTTYTASDSGIDEAKRAAAEARVREWREAGRCTCPTSRGDRVALERHHPLSAERLRDGEGLVAGRRHEAPRGRRRSAARSARRMSPGRVRISGFLAVTSPRRVS